MASRTALILAGRGRYADPWHDTAAAADALAVLLRRLGLEVAVRGTAPDALDDVAGPSLLVVAAGAGRRDAAFDGDDDAWRAFHDRRAGWVADGVPVLAMHQAAMAFADDPRWADELGGRWVEGRSWHPPLGPAVLRVAGRDDAGRRHPVVAGLERVSVTDERYTDLELRPGVRPFVVADVVPREAQDRPTSVGAHPVVWIAPGPGRVLYDALGHDDRSYASPDHRALLTAAVGWLLAG
jgi:hypothetical protein